MSILDNDENVMAEIDETVKRQLYDKVHTWAATHMFIVSNLNIVKTVDRYWAFEDGSIDVIWKEEICNINTIYTKHDFGSNGYYKMGNYKTSSIKIEWDDEIQNWVLLILDPKQPVFIETKSESIPDYIIFKPIKRVKNLYFYDSTEYGERTLTDDQIRVVGKSKINIIKYI